MSAFTTANYDEKDTQALKAFREAMLTFTQGPDCADLPGECTNHLREKLTDSDCLRFVRARKYDVDKGVAMAVKWSEWYYKEFPPHLLHPNGDRITPANSVAHPYNMENVRNAICPHSYMGLDKDSRPIYWEETGLISTRFAELSTYFSVDDLTVQHVRMQELMRVRCEHSSTLHGKCVDKVVCVMNLKGLSYRVDTEALRAFRINLQIDTDFYPERLKYLYMINAPWFFTSLWAMMRPLIDPVTADKIKIVGKDFLPVLREHIDDDQIPPELGGSCPDFKWAYPFPERSGISEAQLGYLESEKSQDDAALQALGEIRSRTNSEDAQPRFVCLAAVVNARITEVERLKSHDEYIIAVQEVDKDDSSADGDSTAPVASVPPLDRQAKHRYSDFVTLRSRLKQLLKSERAKQAAQKNSRQPSVNQRLTLPQLPPKKLFSQTGSVLTSRILGLSSFLTTLLLSVKISDQSVYYPGSALNTSSSSSSSSGGRGGRGVMEDPVVLLIMQFLSPSSMSDAGDGQGQGSPGEEETLLSQASRQALASLQASGNSSSERESGSRLTAELDDADEDDDEKDDENAESPVKSGSSIPDSHNHSQNSGSEGGLQIQLKSLAGGGIVSVAIFGLSVVGMYLQQ